jgi:hypothetical protein
MKKYPGSTGRPHQGLLTSLYYDRDVTYQNIAIVPGAAVKDKTKF